LWTTGSERRTLFTAVDSTGGEATVVLGLQLTAVVWRQVEQEIVPY